MNKLTTAKRAQVIAAITEGVGINATARMTGVSKPTVLKLLADVGKACSEYLDTHVMNLDTKFVQADELWSLIHGRRKNIAPELRDVFGYGDVWTFTAIDARSWFGVSLLLRGDALRGCGFRKL